MLSKNLQPYTLVAIGICYVTVSIANPNAIVLALIWISFWSVYITWDTARNKGVLKSRAQVLRLTLALLYLPCLFMPKNTLPVLLLVAMIDALLVVAICMPDDEYV
jgi:hypothetical protein